MSRITDDRQPGNGVEECNCRRLKLCASCGALAYDYDKYCARCGNALFRVCRSCGACIDHPVAFYCTQCGEVLTDSELESATSLTPYNREDVLASVTIRGIQS
jgi:hypothetical protein